MICVERIDLKTGYEQNVANNLDAQIASEDTGVLAREISETGKHRFKEDTEPQPNSLHRNAESNWCALTRANTIVDVKGVICKADEPYSMDPVLRRSVCRHIGDGKRCANEWQQRKSLNSNGQCNLSRAGRLRSGDRR